MKLINALKSLLGGGKSVEQILNQHRRTIDALSARSAKMDGVSRDLEDELLKTKARLEQVLLERKRAEVAADAMKKVFGIADEVTL